MASSLTQQELQGQLRCHCHNKTLMLSIAALGREYSGVQAATKRPHVSTTDANLQRAMDEQVPLLSIYWVSAPQTRGWPRRNPWLHATRRVSPALQDIASRRVLIPPTWLLASPSTCLPLLLDNSFLGCRDILRYNEMGLPGLGSAVPSLVATGHSYDTLDLP